MKTLCECCEQRPALGCVRFDDGAWFAVCQLCAPVVLPRVRTFTQPELVSTSLVDFPHFAPEQHTLVRR